MKIADILRTKGRGVVTVSPDTPIQEATRMLVDHDIGSLVVHDGRIRGILTERDLLRAAARKVATLASARVQDLMTTAVVTASQDTEIEDVMRIMTERRIRHLPIVTRDGALCGMISIGDVVSALHRTVEMENHYLHAYIAGRPL